MPATARFKVWVCGRSLARIAGSNPAGVWILSLFIVMSRQVEVFASVDPSFRGVLSSAVCPCALVKPL